jgi:hypothetical protein
LFWPLRHYYQSVYLEFMVEVSRRRQRAATIALMVEGVAKTHQMSSTVKCGVNRMNVLWERI